MTKVIPIFRDQFSYNPADADEAVNEMPSMTVPEDSWTLAELVERHRNGILTDVEISRQGRFVEGQDFDSPDVEKLVSGDLIDQQEFVRATKARAERFKASVSKAKSDHDLLPKVVPTGQGLPVSGKTGTVGE